ncbi:MAG: hypothetical protein LIO81_08710 [Clostridiales bacterium]|nr:hypothetical protein [Clostridiales bacterium]
MKKSDKTLIAAIAGLFFMFIFGYICPTWSVVTRLGVQYLGIMIGWIVMCSFGFPMSMASVAAIAACTIPGYYTASAVISGSLGNSITALVIFIFVLVYVFEETKTGEFLVRWFLSRRFVNGKPFVFMGVFFFAIIVIGSVIGSFGTIPLAITILNNVANISGIKKQDDWIRFMLIGVVSLSGVTEVLYPFKPYAVLYSGILNNTLASINAATDDSSYFVTALIIAVLSFLALMLAGRFLFCFDLDKIRNLDVAALQQGEFKKMNQAQIIVLIAVVLSFFHPFIIMLLPEGSAVYGFLNSMGQALFMGLILTLLCLIRFDGKPIMNPAVALAKGVNWHVIFAIGAVILIGGALASDDCGVSAWLLEVFNASLGNMGIVPITIVITLLGCVITQFFSNSATAIIFLTAIAPLAPGWYEAGINVSVFPAAVGIGTLTACILPSGSGQSAMMLGTDIFGEDGQKWALSKGMRVLGAIIVATVLAAVISIIIL